MKIKIFFIAIIAFLALASCKKQETIYYEGGDLISFYIDRLELDSINYTFAFHPIPKDRDTVFVKMRVQGVAQPRERLISVKASAETTAELGKDFILPNIVLPADSLTIKYPVVILNSDQLKNKSLKIVVEVEASEDFQPGAIGREVGGTTAMRSYKIWFSDRAEKPAYWSQVQSSFGSFSATRLRFMISTLGFTDFSYAAIGAYGLYTYPVTLRNALARYVEQNGKLIDEFGEEVTF